MGSFSLSPFKRLALGAGVFLAFLTGCAYEGNIDTPPTIKLTWFSYLEGQDIREQCGPDSLVRYRLVYNADYNKQLRSYEVTADGAGGAYLVSRAQTGRGIDLTKFSLSDPLAMGGEWKRSQLRITAEDLASLNNDLTASGAFEPAPVGLRLYSNEYYWVSSLCKDGQFYFNAWLYPSDRYNKIVFLEFFRQYDETGVAFAPPKEVGPEGRFSASHANSTQMVFQVRVEQNGLEGVAGL